MYTTVASQFPKFNHYLDTYNRWIYILHSFFLLFCLQVHNFFSGDKYYTTKSRSPPILNLLELTLRRKFPLVLLRRRTRKWKKLKHFTVAKCPIPTFFLPISPCKHFNQKKKKKITSLFLTTPSTHSISRFASKSRCEKTFEVLEFLLLRVKKAKKKILLKTREVNEPFKKFYFILFLSKYIKLYSKQYTTFINISTFCSSFLVLMNLAFGVIIVIPANYFPYTKRTYHPFKKRLNH